MRLRLASIFALCAISLIASAGAAAYPWPVKPFDQQHPIRGNFGDPRMLFNDGLYHDGVTGPGTFLFHNGIDVAAPDGTRVYPVVSGIARLLNHEAVTVQTNDGRTFQYWHITPAIRNGQRVIAQHTVLGRILHTVGHVHLSEIRGFAVWNPLGAGGIAPYTDLTDPTVRRIYVRRWNSLDLLDPAAVCGRVSIVADAYDTQSLPVSGPFAGFPVGPASLVWRMSRANSTRRLAAATGEVDFRSTLPPADDFWEVYARGTYQNTPRFGLRQYTMPGLFLYQLTRDGLNTRELPNGLYRVTVRAEDIKGNTGTLTQQLTVANVPGTPTGCPVAPPPPPPPAP